MPMKKKFTMQQRADSAPGQCFVEEVSSKMFLFALTSSSFFYLSIIFVFSGPMDALKIINLPTSPLPDGPSSRPPLSLCGFFSNLLILSIAHFSTFVLPFCSLLIFLNRLARTLVVFFWALFLRRPSVVSL